MTTATVYFPTATLCTQALATMAKRRGLRLRFNIIPKAQILNHVFKACFGRADTIPTFKPTELATRQLENFTGRYRASSGMEVGNRLEANTLLLSLKGQDLELTPIATHEFWNKSYGFFFRFARAGKQLLIQDVDAIYELNKP